MQITVAQTEYEMVGRLAVSKAVCSVALKACEKGALMAELTVGMLACSAVGMMVNEKVAAMAGKKDATMAASRVVEWVEKKVGSLVVR